MNQEPYRNFIVLLLIVYLYFQLASTSLESLTGPCMFLLRLNLSFQSLASKIRNRGYSLKIQQYDDSGIILYYILVQFNLSAFT